MLRCKKPQIASNYLGSHKTEEVMSMGSLVQLEETSP